MKQVVYCDALHKTFLNQVHKEYLTKMPPLKPPQKRPQIKIPATYMRGGTSKGVFFKLDDLPKAAQVAGQSRDALLLRVIGSPDPYGKQTDGMGGATSSTSKTVILSKSKKDDHDVDYLFGQVAINKAFVDWSGNCGNLTAAVGSFAISNGLVDADRIPKNGIATVRIWQINIQKTIIAHVPITNGEVQETGGFELDGVTFPAAEVQIEFISPVDAKDAMFPTGNLVDKLEVPSDIVDSGFLNATMINAGIPTIFLNADELGYTGKELQSAINSDEKALAMFEVIRAHGAVRMGLIDSIEEAATRQHTPKVAFISQPQAYISSSGKQINTMDIDLNVRALSMGLLHHAMMGTAAVAIGTAAAIPGTLIHQVVDDNRSLESLNSENLNSENQGSVTFGHPSGTLKVGAEAEQNEGTWLVSKVVMSRSARILMQGTVHIPAESF